jgi:hypothetical protein
VMHARATGVPAVTPVRPIGLRVGAIEPVEAILEAAAAVEVGVLSEGAPADSADPAPVLPAAAVAPVCEAAEALEAVVAVVAGGADKRT